MVSCDVKVWFYIKINIIVDYNDGVGSCIVKYIGCCGDNGIGLEWVNCNVGVIV